MDGLRLEGVGQTVLQTFFAQGNSVLNDTTVMTTLERVYKSTDALLRSSALLPFYFTLLSILLLLIHTLTLLPPIKRLLRTPKDRSATADAPPVVIVPSTFKGEVKEHIDRRGGLGVFVGNLLRLVVCLALLGLTVYAAIEAPGPEKKGMSDEGIQAQGGLKKKGKKKHRNRRPGEEWFSLEEWVEIAQCGVYLYTSFLALLTLVARPRAISIVSKHLTTLLLLAFGIWAYRDLYPLATFTLKPMDGDGGWLTWVRIGLLGLAGAVIPVFTPYRFIPVDPLHPLPPNPEQTASPASFIMFTWLEPVIKKAYSVSHLPYEELPPLADYDHADHLVKQAFPHVDPFLKKAKGRHIFFGLMSLYRWHYIQMAILLTAKVIFDVAGPFTLNKLLLYLETGGEGATVRPWVWCLALFVVPLAGSWSIQGYVFITTRLVVRTEGLITQLIFEHSLRIRMKDDLPTPGTSTVTSVATTPRMGPQESPEEGGEAYGSEDTLQEGRSERGKGKDASTATDTAASTSTAAASAIPTSGAAPDKKDEGGHGANLVGKINNLVSTDLGNLVDGRDFLFLLIWAPLELLLSIWFLYNILGWSAIVGLVTTILTIPIPGKIAQLLNNLQVERMKKTDARVQSVTESMNVIRMIKLFGWESRVAKQVNERRDEELTYLKKRQIYGLVNNNINHALPFITMILTFATYTLIMKQELTASRIFSSIAVFDLIREQLHMAFWEIPLVISGKVSIDRVNEFLNETELLDQYARPDTELPVNMLPPWADPQAIGFRNATFAWRTTSPVSPGGIMTPSRRNFHLRLEGDLWFKKGKLNIIVGPTGCGKTSLLMALLGEMHFKPETMDSYFNLPRDGGVAYAAQEAWILNATIKDNILFGSAFDEKRYKKVVEQCALERDMTLFEAGDATEIGEKGVTLSGGQKARISLARAVYSPAQVVLLDDVLSALDVHTSRWIVDKCLTGDLLKDRTVLLVTHNIAMVSPIADFCVSLSQDGRINCQGDVSEALKDAVLLADVKQTNQLAEDDEKVEQLAGTSETQPPKDDKPTGQLIAKEEIQEGRVGWNAFKFFFGTFGGVWFWTVVMGAIFLCEFTNVFQTWFLGYWARQYNNSPASEVPASLYLTGYGFLVILGMAFYNTEAVVFLFGSIKASRRVHAMLMDAILGTTLRWLDSTPIGRIVARFTQDIRTIDSTIAAQFQGVVEMVVSILLRFISVLVYSPIFLFPGLFVTGLGVWLGSIYMHAQLSVKREMSNAKSPLYSHFSASIAGLTSIRAYGAEKAFKEESKKRIDYYSRSARLVYNLNRWICVRIDGLGGLFAAALAAYLIYGRKVDPSTTGFSLSMALSFTGMLLWAIRLLNDFEVQANSLERVKAYVDIEQEEKPRPEGVPPAYWPASGSLVIKDLCARYSPDGPEVLHGLSFEIKSGERVGVVGRTGAGKSSLSLSLLRMIPTTGTVLFDGLDTRTINLDALRSSITIIPQQPELISGTLRQNLDPFGDYDDLTLNGCLRSAGLFDIQAEADEEDRIGLDTIVGSGGTNFSLGQRQIIALARAMVRRSKVYILDEATASVDYKTDAAIQEVISKEFNDMTLIIVAHRLQTIMTADKILVLDAGKVVEFDSPAALLEKKGGMFKTLVDGSGDREALYAMVKKSG
ncbi:hypothetical protein FRB99_000077 [Tulasnella sp. 403]|nr:hypothetical protein FRB99_000077 [Tulasnella sp. 403]